MSAGGEDRLLALARELRRRSLDAGFAVFGIATAEALAGAPSAANPERLLEGYRAATVLGAPPDAYVDLGPKSPVLLEPKPSAGLVAVREALVAAGFAAVPVTGSTVSLPRVAVAAGIGALAPNSMVVVNRYGLSLQLFAYVTDAPLPGTPLPGDVDDRALCRGCRKCLDDCMGVTDGAFRRDWCSGCKSCLEACPLDVGRR